jgi:hypothetical protein
MVARSATWVLGAFTAAVGALGACTSAQQPVPITGRTCYGDSSTLALLEVRPGSQANAYQPQHGGLVFYVASGSDWRPLAHARVSRDGAILGDTDSLGTLTVHSLRAELASIEVRAIGYMTVVGQVEVSSGALDTVRVLLQPRICYG